jgi:hypothetical protein
MNSKNYLIQEIYLKYFVKKKQQNKSEKLKKEYKILSKDIIFDWKKSFISI